MDKQTSIDHNEVFKEYLKILLEHGLYNEHMETKELVDYIAHMEKHYYEMSKELHEIKQLLYSLQNPQTKSRLTQVIEKTEVMIKDGSEKIENLKNKMVISMKDSIQSLKQKGKNGVVKTINLLHFKEALGSIRKSFFYSMKQSQNLIQTTDILTSEIRQAKSHLKSVGYILSRKTFNMKTVDHDRLNLIQKSARFIHRSFESMTIQTTKILHKLENFEKPSVKSEIKYLNYQVKPNRAMKKKNLNKAR
ncbi:hypothetical protein ERAC_02790 [Thomasclavelia ramosa]|uniref:DUF6674 family protein n=1 Tax=Thomasclavelia ramosa TaxID=1547 RepID=UPI00106978BC|nr:DUF6674 family protein [Thomasclavelia ramosa]VEU18051.1 hypothetical protein ERAC_02790 [Thomasclavelia ramosa]